MNNHYEYILCDLDGPILDGRMRHYQCYLDIVAQFGGNPISIEEYWDMKRRKLSRQVLLERTQFEGSYRDYLDTWISLIELPQYLALDSLKEKAKESLEAIKKHADHLYLITMRMQSAYLYDELQRYHIQNCFDNIIIIPSTSGMKKFEPIKDLKITTGFVIGDTEADTELAEYFHIPLYGILNGLRTREHLVADLYFNELSDIAASL